MVKYFYAGGFVLLVVPVFGEIIYLTIFRLRKLCSFSRRTGTIDSEGTDETYARDNRSFVSV